MPETLLSTRLLELRLAKNLRQKEMAVLLDLPTDTYRKYEVGKRTPNKLALAELLRRLEALPQ